jgi:hypothetical protein
MVMSLSDSKFCAMVHSSVKRNMVFLTALLITANPVYSDPCKPLAIKGHRYRQELKRFIQESEQKGFFKFGQGIVMLGERYDSEGQLNWHINVALEDGYQQTTPTGWTSMKGKIVLVYRADSLNRWNHNMPSPEALACMKQIVGNRVFERAPAPDSWTEPMMRSGKAVLDSTGKPRMITRYRDMIGGGSGNSYRIIFPKSGPAIRLKSV